MTKLKTFLIINGTFAILVHATSTEKAKETAINICDNSKEILVREVDGFIDWTRTFSKE